MHYMSIHITGKIIRRELNGMEKLALFSSCYLDTPLNFIINPYPADTISSYNPRFTAKKTTCYVSVMHLYMMYQNQNDKNTFLVSSFLKCIRFKRC